MSRTWGMAVEYAGAPAEYPEHGHIDERVELAGMTVDGTSRTRITASVTADTEQEAREVGTAGIAELARLLHLPAEPTSVTVAA